MPLHYNANAAIDDRGPTQFAPLVPGTYKFIVQEATERLRETNNHFEKSGCEGMSLKLGVVVEGRMVPCYTHLIYRDDLTWKIKKFMESIGRKFGDQSIEAHDLIGDAGEAEFKVGEWNGKEKFEVDRFNPAQPRSFGGQGSIAMPAQAKTSPHNDDIPF